MEGRAEGRQGVLKTYVLKTMNPCTFIHTKTLSGHLLPCIPAQQTQQKKANEKTEGQNRFQQRVSAQQQATPPS